MIYTIIALFIFLLFDLLAGVKKSASARSLMTYVLNLMSFLLHPLSALISLHFIFFGSASLFE